MKERILLVAIRWAAPLLILYIIFDKSPLLRRQAFLLGQYGFHCYGDTTFVIGYYSLAF